jgi:aspartate/methionine/tyrosine aminotransferase
MRFPENEIISLVGEKPRYDLGESVGPDLRLGELLESTAPSGLADLPLGYSTAEGDPMLRTAVAELHGSDSEHVVIMVGGMQALFLIACILCSRGDEAVITSPLFPPGRNVLDFVGATVRTLPLSFDSGYQPDLSELRLLLSPGTKLVALASPQNPSGVSISFTKLRSVLAAMQEVCPDAYLLVDETYREGAYGNDPIVPSAINLSPKVISVGSLSKCHGAAGLRIGWAITRDVELRRQLVVGKFTTVISCSRVDEALALRLLAQRDRIIAERREFLAEALAKTAGWVNENADLIEWVRPNAGALCCVRLKSTSFNDAAVKRFHDGLAKLGVRVARGFWFNDDSRVFRLGFGFLPLSDLDTALTLVSSALRRAIQAKQ